MDFPCNPIGNTCTLTDICSPTGRDYIFHSFFFLLSLAPQADRTFAAHFTLCGYANKRAVIGLAPNQFSHIECSVVRASLNLFPFEILLAVSDRCNTCCWCMYDGTVWASIMRRTDERCTMCVHCKRNLYSISQCICTAHGRVMRAQSQKITRDAPFVM